MSDIAAAVERVRNTVANAEFLAKRLDTYRPGFPPMAQESGIMLYAARAAAAGAELALAADTALANVEAGRTYAAIQLLRDGIAAYVTAAEGEG